MLKNDNRKLIYLTIIVLVLAIISDLVFKSDLKYSIEASSFKRILKQTELRGKASLEHFAASDRLDQDIIEQVRRNTSSGGYFLFHYQEGKLKLWSDNSFTLLEEYDKDIFQKPFIFLQNRWFIVHTLEQDKDIFLCLISVNRKYDIENNYIKTGFEEKYKLPPGTGFSENESGDYPVYNSDGIFLFNLEFDEHAGYNTLFVVFPLIMWILFMFCLLILINRFAYWVSGRAGSIFGFLTVFVFSILFYFGFLFSGKPEIINNLSLFSPYRFTSGTFLPTPGHMLLLSILFLFLAYGFYRYFPLRDNPGEKSSKDFIFLSVYFSVGAIIFLLFSRLLAHVITGSTINFEIHKILDLDYFTVLTFLSAALMMAGLIIYLLRVLMACQFMPLRTLTAAAGFSLLVLFLLLTLTGSNPIVHMLVFTALITAVKIFQKNNSGIINMAVVFAFITGAYAAYYVPKLEWEKESRNLEVFAVNYSSDNDLYAEALLIDSWEKMRQDTLLEAYLKVDYFEDEIVTSVYEYLDNKYFNGYWDNYEKIYTLCNEDSPLIIAEDGKVLENCFDFFETRVEQFGTYLSDSNLVFLENQSGRAYYLGCLFIELEDKSRNGLFIELINQIEYIQAGYPELLVDKSNFKQPLFKKYSLGKYINDSLVIQTGTYPFDQVLKEGKNNNEYFTYSETGYKHLVYNYSPEISIQIARETLTFVDHIVTFTYLFIFSFLLLSFVLLLARPPATFSLKRSNFRQKLQYSYTIILLVSIIAIGTVVIILSIAQYQDKHLDNIKEKLSSTYIELEHKLSQEQVLSPDWSADNYENLDALLIKFSNVFYTDLNLYYPDGSLLASSRKEVFLKGLTGYRMNYFAYDKLHIRGESQFIHEEKIGELRYLSAYIPFVNEHNELLAYLNLPYFAMQSRITEEISNLVVAIINFSLILILISMSLAVFISTRITNPLRMLQEGLASVKLGKKSKHLEFRGHDEIAELVNQYNIMLDELSESAVKLARSEREDAWREMAKQIAHEIKNPLTPMKLNVQQLQKWWKDKEKDFSRRLDKFTENQIEHIDNLSSIATEFSHFARMPKASPRETDLVSQIYSVAELYKNISNIKLDVNCNGLKEVIIYADKEQMNSMFSNLLRNAVQAVPSSREGEVSITLTIKEGKAMITIKDNGVGIPEALKDKLFSPNFTTKSSGMGLGLAIVKRIVETANGKVWFESAVDKGTIFNIEYPVISSR